MNNIFICKICKNQCKSHGTGFHLKYYHNITFKEYYDLYLKKENEGFCLECGKPTKFQDGKHGYRQFCSLKCSNKSELTQNKKENTCLLHYGVKYPSKNSDIREKQKATCRLHYGVNTPSESTIIREKQKETCFKNNGVYFPMQSKEIQEKSKNTCLANYNVEHPLQNNNIKLKFKETCLNNLGVENPSFSENIIKKRSDTYNKKYGYSNPSYNRDVILKRAKKYKYNNINFDSAWELAYYIWLKDHNIDFEYQPDISFEYEYNNKKHRYYPDFLVEDEIQEIKGTHFFENCDSNNKMICPYNRDLDDFIEAKHQCMIKNNIKIITDCTKYLNYIKNTYGNDYIKQFKQ